MMQDIGEARSTAEAPDLGTLIGTRVRRYRTGRGWTLDQLAARSAVSRRMLVNIEHGAANPSIATLLRISDALGVGLPVLVSAGRSALARVTRAGDAPVLWRGPSGGSATLVAGTESPDVVELWDWTLAPGESHSSEPHSAGTRELLLVLAGHVQVRLGQEDSLLGPGDSIAFSGDVAHGYAHASDAGRAAGGGPAEPARFALTVFEPRVGTGDPR